MVAMAMTMMRSDGNGDDNFFSFSAVPHAAECNSCLRQAPCQAPLCARCTYLEVLHEGGHGVLLLVFLVAGLGGQAGAGGACRSTNREGGLLLGSLALDDLFRPLRELQLLGLREEPLGGVEGLQHVQRQGLVFRLDELLDPCELGLHCGLPLDLLALLVDGRHEEAAPVEEGLVEIVAIRQLAMGGDALQHALDRVLAAVDLALHWGGGHLQEVA
eukprot:6967775-Lingulodinium_polyedra.AAC.1